jgi:flagellar biosynthesis protein FlhB
MADEAGEKTEVASGKRREDARNEGQVAKSQEVAGAILLFVGVVVLVASSGHFARVLGENTHYLLSQAHFLAPNSGPVVRELMIANFKILGTALGPMLFAVFITAIGANVMQFGLHFSTKSLSFKLDKLNPISGMKKFFQKKAFFDLAKNFFKILIIAMLSNKAISSWSEEIYEMALMPIPAIVAFAKISFIKLMAILLFFTAVLAVIDWFWQKRQHENSIKMTKQEVKQEYKDTEGDPQLKARIRNIQFEMTRKRMLADVPTADVIITNPTHFAVAIKYEAGSSAPIVVAKGKDNIAQIIKKIGREHRVPIIENKPLARSLHRQVEIGQSVPESLFQAVAEVLAYIYRLKKA